MCITTFYALRNPAELRAAPLAEHVLQVTCAAPRTHTPLRAGAAHADAAAPVAQIAHATGTRGPRVHVAPAGAAALDHRPFLG